MRIHEVVALNVRASSVNTPGEFLIVAVDQDGLMHQCSGQDVGMAASLLSMLADMEAGNE